MSITKEQSDQLKDYFPVRAHEFLNGNTYITEEAITNRLDEVDPSWSLERLDVYRNESVVTAIFRLTVGGVSRDGVGMAAVQLSKDKDREVNEAEKSAATDALKRAARLFGIGRYILEMGKDVKDYGSLERWLAQKRRIDTSTGEIALVSKNGEISNVEGGTRDLAQAAGDYQRTPQQKLAGNGAPPAGEKKRIGQDEPDTHEWTASSVIVRKDKNDNPYLQYICNEGKPTGRGRDLLRKAGYDCEDWTAPGITYDLIPPALVTVQKNGNFWNVLEVKPQTSEVAF